MKRGFPWSPYKSIRGRGHLRFASNILYVAWTLLILCNKLWDVMGLHGRRMVRQVAFTYWMLHATSKLQTLIYKLISYIWSSQKLS